MIAWAKRPKIVFFTHSGQIIGGGHLSRCKALASALERVGASIRWVINPEARQSLQGSLDEVHSLENPFSTEPGGVAALESFMDSASLVIVDSYNATASWLESMAIRHPLLVIDDFRDRPVELKATGLLNYNLNAERIPYEKIPGQLRLLGPHYALLRPEVGQLAERIGGDPEVVEDYIFFVAGASDTVHATIKIISWWKEDWPPLVAILGPLVSKDYLSSCQTVAQNRANVTVLQAPAEFLKLMNRAKRVICTSSVTAYEALALRKNIAVFQVAQNQVGIALESTGQNLATNMGFWGTFGPEEVERFLYSPVLLPSQVVNPKGADAAAEILKRHFFPKGDLTR